MTLPSQFSLEEENFYKDIQDLVKKGSQNGRELSVGMHFQGAKERGKFDEEMHGGVNIKFLERYKDLVARADLDDETFIINFAKAGLIIEASAKVYGIKVDSLWTNLEHVLESLKNKGSLQGKGKKVGGDNEGDLDGGGCEDINDDEEKRKAMGFGRRRKKLGDAFFSSDDFLEIDSITGLLGKNMNESNTSHTESKLKLCEKIPNMFIKTKMKKKKIDVCLNKFLDKDIIRLRDWIISAECLLMKEIYTKLPENVYSISRVIDEEGERDAYENNTYQTEDRIMFDDKDVSMVQESIRLASESLKDEKNNNFETGLVPEPSLKPPDPNEKLNTSGDRESFANDFNVSRESDVARFPNVIERVSGDCLVDVDEVFWNPSKFQDVIPSKKRRAGKTNKLNCQLCVEKKLHTKKGKKCLENSKKLECLDSYFTPHVQPVLTESQFGILPDEELYSAYKAEMKLIEQLKKVDVCKNTNGAYFPDENAEELINFLGFDGFENNLIRKPDLQEDPMPSDNVLFEPLDVDDEPFTDDLNTDKDMELPFPVVENDGNRGNTVSRVMDDLMPNDNLENAEAEYQKLVTEELKEHYAAKSSFAKNKELGLKISRWFEMISDKIKLSQKRGALNMKMLSSKIMGAFPSLPAESKPVMPFQDLVSNRCRRDVPRYFFACLQLANEGNLEISKSSNKSLATDCMLVTRLKLQAISRKSDEHSVLSPSKECSSPRESFVAQSKRKRNSSDSSSTVEAKIHGKQKRPKQKLVKPCKRPKNFNSANELKRRRCSMSSVDSATSE